jgi:hypothetical protein
VHDPPSTELACLLPPAAAVAAAAGVYLGFGSPKRLPDVDGIWTIWDTPNLTVGEQGRQQPCSRKQWHAQSPQMRA